MRYRITLIISLLFVCCQYSGGQERRFVYFEDIKSDSIRTFVNVSIFFDMQEIPFAEDEVIIPVDKDIVLYNGYRTYEYHKDTTIIEDISSKNRPISQAFGSREVMDFWEDIRTDMSEGVFALIQRDMYLKGNFITDVGLNVRIYPTKEDSVKTNDMDRRDALLSSKANSVSYSDIGKMDSLKLFVAGTVCSARDRQDHKTAEIDDDYPAHWFMDATDVKFIAFKDGVMSDILFSPEYKKILDNQYDKAMNRIYLKTRNLRQGCYTRYRYMITVLPEKKNGIFERILNRFK